MPNQIDATGLKTATQTELVTQLNTDLESIYGSDINIDPSTPDGQLINIFVQAVLDCLDLLVQVNNSFDPDHAIGTILDQRVAINGIQRLAGDFTLTPVSITVDRALTLPGLDGAIDDPNGLGYSVADNAGNQWILTETQAIAAPGTYVFNFRAQNAGAILTTPNTITIPVTIILGVTGINNPSRFTKLGLNEETDAQLRVRRQKSVSLASQGYLAALLAALENINGVTSAFVYENVTDATDGSGLPGHSIWAIVQGGDDASIAEAIYTKRNAGCGMKGSVIHTITQVDGSPFVVRWDVVQTEDLFIAFNVSSLNGIDAPDVSAIAAQMPDLLVPGVFEQVNINDLATLVQQVDPNALVTNAGFSAAALGPFTNTLQPSSKNFQFVLSSANISITVV